MSAVGNNTKKYISIIRQFGEISVEDLILKSEKSPSTYEKYRRFIPKLASDISYNEEARLWVAKMT